jgi:hypothetical protein
MPDLDPRRVRDPPREPAEGHERDAFAIPIDGTSAEGPESRRTGPRRARRRTGPIGSAAARRGSAVGLVGPAPRGRRPARRRARAPPERRDVERPRERRDADRVLDVDPGRDVELAGCSTSAARPSAAYHRDRQRSPPRRGDPAGGEQQQDQDHRNDGGNEEPAVQPGCQRPEGQATGMDICVARGLAREGRKQEAAPDRQHQPPDRPSRATRRECCPSRTCR